MVFLLFVLTQTALGATDASWHNWTKARELYDSKQYAAALDELRAQKDGSGQYFYNLGSVYYRLNQFGIATAYLEKANGLIPHDGDVQHNLKLSRARLQAQLGKSAIDPASTWLEQAADGLPISEVRGVLGLLLLFTVVLWVRPYRRTRSIRQTLFRPSGWIGLFALVCTTVLYGIERVGSQYQPAVCIENTIVRSGPGDHFLELAQIQAGVKLRLAGPTAQATRTSKARDVMSRAQAQSIRDEASEPAGGDTANSSPAAASPELWRQVRFKPESVGWVRDSSLLVL